MFQTLDLYAKGITYNDKAETVVQEEGVILMDCLAISSFSRIFLFSSL